MDSNKNRNVLANQSRHAFGAKWFSTAPSKGGVLLNSIFCFVCVLLLALSAQAQGVREFVIRFKEKPKVEGSLIRFGDLLEIRGDEKESQRLAELPLIPSPANGVELKIRKEDILQQLQIRNVDMAQIRWLGEGETTLKTETKSEPKELLKTSSLLPAYATDRNFQQAERNLKDVVKNYLALKDSNLNGATFQFDIPKSQLELFFQRRNIREIGGGAEPWTGEQTFTLQVMSRNELIEVPIRAVVTPPETVVVAVRPLRRGDVVEAEDLRMQVVTFNKNSNTDSDLFTDFKDVVGKQLRRSISSGQAIGDDDVGPPIVVEKNQLIQIKVIVGGIEVETAGRAITEGATGDLVQVETIHLKERKKLTAQVIDSNSVQVIAAGINATRR
jgi:flagella basal body P-ring formation protein FlgA